MTSLKVGLTDVGRGITIYEQQGHQSVLICGLAEKNMLRRKKIGLWVSFRLLTSKKLFLVFMRLSLYGAALIVSLQKSVHPYRASDFLEIGKQ